MVKPTRRRDRLQRIMLVPVSPLRQLSTRAAWGAAVLLCVGLAFMAGRWSSTQTTGAMTQQLNQVTQSSQNQLRSLEERTDIRLKDCGIIQAASERLQEDNPELLASLALNASAPAPPTQLSPSSQPSPPSRRAGQTRASSSATKGAVSRASAGVPGVT